MSFVTADKAITSALGPIAANPIVVNDAAVGTTPVLILAASSTPLNKARRCKILLRSAAGEIGWMTTYLGDAAPAMVTSTGAFCSIITQAMGFEYVNVFDTQNLYVVGSAAGLSVQVTYVED